MDIRALWSSFEQVRALVLGDVMLDEYIVGNVSRISPEAPVGVLQRKEQFFCLGGGANVAHNIFRLGATPHLISVIGDDHEGEVLVHLLQSLGMRSDGLIRSASRTTSVKTRFMSGGHHLLRVDKEQDMALEADLSTRYLQASLKALDESDVVIFQDYDKGVLSPRFIQEVVKAAHRKGIKVVADPKFRHFFSYEGVDLLKPNLKEFRAAQQSVSKGGEVSSGTESFDIKALEKEVQNFCARMDVGAMLVTLSEKGMYLQDREQRLHVASRAHEVVDVSGAGDSVISVVGICMALGVEAEIMLHIANLAAGWVCEQAGAVPIEGKVLLERMKKYNFFKKR